MRGRRRGATHLAAALLAAAAVTGCSHAPEATTNPQTTGARASSASITAPGGSVGSSTPGVVSASTVPGSARPPTTVASAGGEVESIGTYPVGRRRLELVDLTHDTAANGTFGGAKGRKLPTLVWYPAAGAPSGDRTHPRIDDDVAARPGRFPLVVFGHGVTASAELYTSSLAAFASAGYVVVAPDFPLSSSGAPGGPVVTDVAHQPADLSFLIDRFTGVDLADRDGSASTSLAAVVRSIDPERVAVGGHSLGAISALGIGYNPCCDDDRVDGVFDWAGGFYPMLGQSAPDPSVHDRPLLIVHGDQDETVPYAKSEAVFAATDVPRWFITLTDGGHVPGYLAGFAQVHSTLVIETTKRFLDAELKGDETGLTDLVARVRAAGPAVATIRTASP